MLRKTQPPDRKTQAPSRRSAGAAGGEQVEKRFVGREAKEGLVGDGGGRFGVGVKQLNLWNSGIGCCRSGVDVVDDEEGVDRRQLFVGTYVQAVGIGSARQAAIFDAGRDLIVDGVDDEQDIRGGDLTVVVDVEVRKVCYVANDNRGGAVGNSVRRHGIVPAVSENVVDRQLIGRIGREGERTRGGGKHGNAEHFEQAAAELDAAGKGTRFVDQSGRGRVS